MKHIVTAVVLLCSAAPRVFADVTRYERTSFRELLFGLIANPPQTPIRLVGTPSSDARAREFLAYYQTRIAPTLAGVRDSALRQTSYEMLILTVSQESDAELAEWENLKTKYDGELNAHATDGAFTDRLREWVRLGEGLRGNLPSRARRMLKTRVLDDFDPSAKPLLDELEVQAHAISTAQRKAPANRTLESYRQTEQEIVLAFKTGKIDFPTARARLEILNVDRGPHVLGFQAAGAAADALNRAAVLRSRLAHTKKYPTWAAYRLNQNGAGYDQRYRGVVGQRKFLTELLSGLERPFHKFLDDRIAELGLKGVDVPQYAADLITPLGFEPLSAHFPGGEITNMFQQTMLESGFRGQTLSQMLIDDGSRAGKAANIAFMNLILHPEAPFETINQGSLDVQTPPRKDLRPALALIYQTYNGEGVDDLSTAHHEGGHGTDYILRDQDDFTLPEAYGTTEIASMASEGFARDPEVLYARAVSIDGREPTLKEIKILVDNVAKNRLVDLVRWTSQSLYDIALWDYDYAAPGAHTYLERVAELSETYNVFLNRYSDHDLPVPRMYKWLSTGHFVSGNVRYSGYVFAELGAHMVADYISRQLEARTGRRGWYQQPQFADVYANDVVRNLWRTTFPANVEAITGREFSTETPIRHYERLVDPGCEVFFKE